VPEPKEESRFNVWRRRSPESEASTRVRDRRSLLRPWTTTGGSQISAGISRSLLRLCHHYYRRVCDYTSSHYFHRSTSTLTECFQDPHRVLFRAHFQVVLYIFRAAIPISISSRVIINIPRYLDLYERMNTIFISLSCSLLTHTCTVVIRQLAPLYPAPRIANRILARLHASLRSNVDRDLRWSVKLVLVRAAAPICHRRLDRVSLPRLQVSHPFYISYHTYRA
jgi:hypothetical protein